MSAHRMRNVNEILPKCHHHTKWCASGCVVECRICNREVAGSNLSLGYFAPPFTQGSNYVRNFFYMVDHDVTCVIEELVNLQLMRMNYIPKHCWITADSLTVCIMRAVVKL